MNDAPAPVIARRLLRTALTATLGTVNEDGSPHVSFLAYATRMDGTPLLLLSRLAVHTRNLQRDPRMALLVADAPRPRGDPMDSARVSLAGTIRLTDDPVDRERYLRRHPPAELYAGFGDFAFYAVVLGTVHYVGGFARAKQLSATDLLLAPDWVTALSAAERDIVSHMNTDHAEAVRLYATRLLAQSDAEWQLTGIDPEGCDLRAENATCRLDFANVVHNADEARSELVRLARAARAA
jgi:putative heme iron utilization protein